MTAIVQNFGRNWSNLMKTEKNVYKQKLKSFDQKKLN